MCNMKDGINIKQQTTPQLLYTNKYGSIYEGDIVQCFDVVAWNVTCLTGKELTLKMVSNARVAKPNNKDY